MLFCHNFCTSCIDLTPDPGERGQLARLMPMIPDDHAQYRRHDHAGHQQGRAGILAERQVVVVHVLRGRVVWVRMVLVRCG